MSLSSYSKNSRLLLYAIVFALSGILSSSVLYLSLLWFSSRRFFSMFWIWLAFFGSIPLFKDSIWVLCSCFWVYYIAWVFLTSSWWEVCGLFEPHWILSSAGAPPLPLAGCLEEKAIFSDVGLGGALEVLGWTFSQSTSSSSSSAAL